MGGDQNISPWRMWGSSERLSARLSLLAGPGGHWTVAGTAERQLTAIHYARPETWSFFLAATLLDCTPQPPAGVGRPVVTAHFDVTIGVGRSQIVLVDFVKFQLVSDFAPGANSFPVPLTFYTTRAAAGPASYDATATPPLAFGLPIEEVCSEEINVLGRVTIEIPPTTDNNAPLEASMLLHSYWAPRVHVRPEWFGNEDKGFYGPGSSVPRFPGGEDKGK